MLYIHITAGVISICAAFVALYATKGATLHRRAGLAFTVAMLTMTLTALVIATWLRPNTGNVVASLVTCYLVATGAMAVRQVPHAKGLLAGLMATALAVGVAGLALGFAALERPRANIDGIPAFAFFMFGTTGLAGSLLDWRVLRHGLQGKARIVRHLWRMGFAAWIATASFFLGQAKFLPEFMRTTGLIAVPVLAVMITVAYWLVRTLRGRAKPRAAAATVGALPAGA